MKLSSLILQSIKAKFKQFCKHCTLHGVYYFYERSQPWVHGIWTLIILSSLCLCCFLSHMIWDKFAVDPTLTVVETTRYSTANVPFPAVTICDTNPVYPPNTDNITHLLKLRGYSETQINEFYESFTEVKKHGYTPKPYVRKMHFLLNNLGYPYKHLLYTFKRPCDEILHECFWRSQLHNCSEMFRPVFSVNGYCCRFDIPFFMKNNQGQTNFISGIQPSEALEITIQTKKSGTGQDEHVSLYTYDYKDKITLLTNPVIITPNSYFDVNIYLWTIDSSTYVKELALDLRKCYLDTDISEGSTTYEGCMTRLILKEAIKVCQCIPFEYTAAELDRNDLGDCIWERLICIYENIDKIQADIRPVMSETECYQRCDYTQYENKVELVKNARNLRKLDEERCKVSVHFGETTCIKYRREVLYTWDQMLANLGGIFGLCLGGSIISIIEILWFMIEVTLTILNEIIRNYRANKTLKAQKNKIFAIKEDFLKDRTQKKPNMVKPRFIH